MTNLTIYRGANQIGGGCTEIAVGGERILIDFGANLPDTDFDSSIADAELTKRVFGSCPTADAVLFTHYHGDHDGLYKEIPEGVPMYIGSIAKDILQELVPRLDYHAEKKGAPIVEKMLPYEPGKWQTLSDHISVKPLYVDHSALDAYMLYIKADGKKILFTGDFRDHGLQSESNRLWRTLERYVNEGVDVLVTEGTMLSRLEEAAKNPVQTELELGQTARELFEKRKYNFVVLSSTNIDSIVMFFRNTPKGMPFICDSYQAKVLLKAMKGMDRRNFSIYRPSKFQDTIYIWLSGEDEDLSSLEKMGGELSLPIRICPADTSIMNRKGFVFLTRRNIPAYHQWALKKYFPTKDSQNAHLIYSMWTGYLKGQHQDKKLLAALDGRPVVPLHTSGHAYVNTIARLIEQTDPRVIIPMHTECAKQFKDFPEFARWKDRVRPLADGEVLDLSAAGI